MKLSKEICLSMKGVAIMCIMMHNLLHCVYIKENEFIFKLDNFHKVNSLSVINWDSLFDFISFWGWYGVPIFIFLSGYGLSQKYESPNSSNISRSKFLLNHFVKLWCLLMPAYIVYLFIIWSKWEGIYIRPALAQSSMLINLIYSPEVIRPGVYWFFGLMLQLYIIYSFFCYKKKDLWLILLSFLSFTFMCFLIVSNGADGRWIEYVRHNSIGWLLIFCLGVLYGRRCMKQFEMNISLRICILVIILLFALLLIWLSNFNVYTWLLSPIFSILIIASVSKMLSSHHLIFKFSVKMGEISSFLFVIHPLVRECFLLNNYNASIPIWDIVLYLFLSILFSFVYKPIYKMFLSQMNIFVSKIFNKL